MRQNIFQAGDALPYSPTLEALREHQAEVHRESQPCGVDRCPHCKSANGPGDFFRRHGHRDRGLRVIVGRLIHKVEIRLLRWRCPCCGGTFTDYPPFMLAFKQYARPEMVDRSLRFVDVDRLTYRRAVLESMLPIFHAEAHVNGSDASEYEKEAEANPVLAHTTLYRWITTLGENAPRFVMVGTSIAKSKFRTRNRERLLSTLRYFISPS